MLKKEPIEGAPLIFGKKLKHLKIKSGQKNINPESLKACQIREGQIFNLRENQ